MSWLVSGQVSGRVREDPGTEESMDKKRHKDNHRISFTEGKREAMASLYSLLVIRDPRIKSNHLEMIWRRCLECSAEKM